MFPKHHFVVRKIEESTGKIFSVIRGIGCDLPKTDSGKITCLYFDKVHNSQEYREIVYKTINGFILHYERGGGKRLEKRFQTKRLSFWTCMPLGVDHVKY